MEEKAEDALLHQHGVACREVTELGVGPALCRQITVLHDDPLGLTDRPTGKENDGRQLWSGLIRVGNTVCVCG